MEIPDDLTVWADQHSVRQILGNLLSNALKYSPKQTAVVISAALSQPPPPGTDAPAQVEISVKDAGPGIPLMNFPCSLDNLCVSSAILLGRCQELAWGSI